MKRITLLLLFALAIVMGCNKIETPIGTVDDLSPFARKFLGMQNAGINSFAMTGSGGLKSGFDAAMDGFELLSSADPGMPSDSAIVGPSNDCCFTTCANVTEILNGDGSTTVITDYGAGCEEGYGEWRYYMFGKNTNTYRYSSSQIDSRFSYEYLNRYSADNFGGKYYWDMDNDGDRDTTTWISNGSSNFSGASWYDTATQEFSGHYKHSDTSTYSVDNESYVHKSVGESKHDNKKLTVTLNNYEYRNGSNFYHSVVLIPLVSDYTCFAGIGAALLTRPFWLVYVSGRERVTYNQDGVSGAFEVDYGNGECDSIITIIENGKIIRLDLSADFAILAEGN